MRIPLRRELQYRRIVESASKGSIVFQEPMAKKYKPDLILLGDDDGPLMVNKQRAVMLGIFLTDKMGIEEYVEKALVFGG